MRRLIHSFLLLFVFFTIYYWLSVYLIEEKQFFHLKPIFFAEKARLATEGVVPRIENIGFVYPPFVFLPFLLFRDVPISVAFFSSIISYTIFNLPKRYILAVLFIFSPPFLYAATQRPDIFLSFTLLALSLRYFALYMENAVSVHIFISGLFFGMSFFADFRTILLVPYILISGIILLRGEKNTKRNVAVLGVFLTPVVAFMFMWMYINWVFTGNPLHFIESPYSYFKTFSPLEGNPAGFYLTNLILALGYLIGVIFIKRNIMPLYLLPPVFLLLSTETGLVDGFMVNAVLFLIFFLVFSDFFRFNVVLRSVLFLNLILLLPAMYFSPDLNERDFFRAFIGMNVKGNLVDYKNTSLFLNKNSGDILMDDALNFPVVYFAENIKRYILPYRSDFSVALSAPHLFADWVVVNKNFKKDVVRAHIEKDEIFKLNFQKAYENEKFVVYKNVKPISVSLIKP